MRDLIVRFAFILLHIIPIAMIATINPIGVIAGVWLFMVINGAYRKQRW